MSLSYPKVAAIYLIWNAKSWRLMESIFRRGCHCASSSIVPGRLRNVNLRLSWHTDQAGSLPGMRRRVRLRNRARYAALLAVPRLSASDFVDLGNLDGTQPFAVDQVVPGYLPDHPVQEQHVCVGPAPPSRCVLEVCVVHEAQAHGNHATARSNPTLAR